jgi:gliding motility-associated lipoprotein GldH
LARKDGKWLGSGMGDLRNFTLPIETDFAVKDTGTYRVNLYQYMRRENLKGVRDVGIKVVKKDEVI